MAGTVEVIGLAELRRAFAVASSEMSKDLNEALKASGEPVRQDAETLAVQRIKPGKIPWSSMRLGITRHTVYVAPVQRRGVTGRRREKFKTKLLDEAMGPALVANSDRVAREFEDAVRDMGKAWARV